MIESKTLPYQPKHHVRIVTAASLFDGHDAAINIMRRILQASGAEVIHLGHNRSVQQIVDCAIQEDAQGIAITSYQGGHVEFFKYMHDLLEERGAKIKLFGGGGGTILPSEIEELHAYGIDRIYSPDDGRSLGLQGMINDVLERCDFDAGTSSVDGSLTNEAGVIARLVTTAENHPEKGADLQSAVREILGTRKVPVLGITGTGGAGKSSLVDELVRRYLLDFEEKTIAVISVDPSKRKSGGALLGDRIRMNAIDSDRVYMRSLATRQANLALSAHVQQAIDICKAAGYDLVIVETSGIGQSDTEITEHSDVSLYVMTAEFGAQTQLEKIDMLDFADVVAINKFDKRGSLDALRDVRKQFKRNHNLFEAADDDLPIYGTIASQFNDPGTNILYRKLMDVLVERTGADLKSDFELTAGMQAKRAIIPPERTRYLAEIVESSEANDRFIEEQASIARRLYRLRGAIELLGESDAAAELTAIYEELERTLDHTCQKLLKEWPETKRRLESDAFQYNVRGKIIEQPLYTTSLSGTRIPRLSLPKYQDWGDILRWLLREGVPGAYPFTAGVFPLKRQGEDPARMFAGEGGPERTNKRFHYLSRGLPTARLSTAFDSVTLYGEDPATRPDIYGKVGNSGVSICTLDDAKKLYSGFNLADPKTSVSMTINGPAPMLLAFFMNAAIDQQCELYIRENRVEVESKIAAIFAGRERPRYQG
ncbi:MAG: methylmalonyl-CoA mutase family protein, partial [Planctomycetota bacterium]